MYNAIPCVVFRLALYLKVILIVVPRCDEIIRIYIYRSYRQRIVLNRKEPVYQAVGGHTFFIPTDEGFKVSTSIMR